MFCSILYACCQLLPLTCENDHAQNVYHALTLPADYHTWQGETAVCVFVIVFASVPVPGCVSVSASVCFCMPLCVCVCLCTSLCLPFSVCACILFCLVYVSVSVCLCVFQYGCGLFLVLFCECMSLICMPLCFSTPVSVHLIAWIFQRMFVSFSVFACLFICVVPVSVCLCNMCFFFF